MQFTRQFSPLAKSGLGTTLYGTGNLVSCCFFPSVTLEQKSDEKLGRFGYAKILVVQVHAEFSAMVGQDAIQIMKSRWMKYVPALLHLEDDEGEDASYKALHILAPLCGITP